MPALVTPESPLAAQLAYLAAFANEDQAPAASPAEPTTPDAARADAKQHLAEARRLLNMARDLAQPAQPESPPSPPSDSTLEQRMTALETRFAAIEAILG
jgi:hypothetical protein